MIITHQIVQQWAAIFFPHLKPEYGQMCVLAILQTPHDQTRES
jgi:hypothetical protein